MTRELERSEAEEILGVRKRRFLQLMKEHGVQPLYRARKVLVTVRVAVYSAEDIERVRREREPK